MTITRDKHEADMLHGLRAICGYLGNGTHETVTISQDDATREFIITVGTTHLSRRSYSGLSFFSALQAAINGEAAIGRV